MSSECGWPARPPAASWPTGCGRHQDRAARGRPGARVRPHAGLDLDANPPFEMDNRSKRSIVLDLNTDEGRKFAFELLSDADVFVTNVRLGALRRLGLDFESVAAAFPRVVYGLITGYGETGPTPSAPPTTSPRSGRAPG
ncbi:coA-transferase III family protein [Mycobacterium xenopi 3993]|nr:coA-transferase III family protein [Mycobacterium xenopi 3993]